MGGFTLVLSILLVIAISKIPKVIVYGTIGFSFVIIVLGILGGLLLGLSQMMIAFAIFGVLWVIMLVLISCCLKEQFNTAIALFKVTGQFLSKKPSVLLAPIITLLGWLGFFAFWLVSFIAIQ